MAGRPIPTRDFARRALDACDCAAGIDVFAYHTYPGYGQNINPETMDYGRLWRGIAREVARAGARLSRHPQDIPFWDDEFNSIPAWAGSDESVQSKYIPRGLLYNWARGVRTFVWLLTAATDGNEYDDFGDDPRAAQSARRFHAAPGVLRAPEYQRAVLRIRSLDPSIQIAPADRSRAAQSGATVPGLWFSQQDRQADRGVLAGGA